jgi:hypothetical protein
MKERKQYVYIGQYYHLRNKELPLDFKFGVTDNLNQREYSLGRTKSPIKYMLLRAWEIPSNVKREKVEKLISTIFDDYKYDGCEWYDIDGDMFQDKITTLFEVISDMVDDVKFSFVEVNLDRVSTTTTKDIIEKEIESEIRQGKRMPWSNLKVEIDGLDLTGDNARTGFINFVNKVIEKVGDVKLASDFSEILKSDPLLFPSYAKGTEYLGNFYLRTHCSSQSKKTIMEKMIDKYSLDAKVNLFTT